MKRILIIIIALVSLFGVQRVKAWGGVGHAIIGYKAEEILSDEVKEKCYHYLRASITYHSSWMDQYRSIEPYTVCDKWHSTNIDANCKVVVGSPTTGAYHIERIRKEMINGGYKNMPDSLVKINLQYLIHMIGDHHCPVHVRWNKDEHPEYVYNLRGKGRPFRWHAFWDSAYSRKRKGWNCEKFSAHLGTLPKSKVKKIQKGTGYDWTQETADVSRYCCKVLPKDTEITTLSDEKIATIHQIVDKQLLYAAYRLAGVLTEIFGEEKSRK